MPLISMAAPCAVSFDTPNGFRAIVVKEGTIALVIGDDVTCKLAPKNPLKCVLLLLSDGTIVAEDRERMGGWQSRAI